MWPHSVSSEHLNVGIVNIARMTQQILSTTAKLPQSLESLFVESFDRKLLWQRGGAYKYMIGGWCVSASRSKKMMDYVVMKGWKHHQSDWQPHTGWLHTTTSLQYVITDCSDITTPASTDTALLSSQYWPSSWEVLSVGWLRWRGRQYDGACFCDNNIFIIILMFFTWENIKCNIFFCLIIFIFIARKEQHSGGDWV